MGRITRLIENGRFYTDLGIDPLEPGDRPRHDLRLDAHAEGREGAGRKPWLRGRLAQPSGDFVVERAFVG